MKNKKWAHGTVYGLLIIAIAVSLFPVYWMVVSSFKPNSRLISWPG